MLKIKEDKMKDLDGMGYTKIKDFCYYKKIGNNKSIQVDINDRTISLDIGCKDVYSVVLINCLDDFYELFKNDMVEKVVEDE